jgi:hypothetical protein
MDHINKIVENYTVALGLAQKRAQEAQDLAETTLRLLKEEKDSHQETLVMCQQYCDLCTRQGEALAKYNEWLEEQPYVMWLRKEIASRPDLKPFEEASPYELSAFCVVSLQQALDELRVAVANKGASSN